LTATSISSEKEERLVSQKAAGPRRRNLSEKLRSIVSKAIEGNASPLAIQALTAQPPNLHKAEVWLRGSCLLDLAREVEELKSW
jgi:hypothetical protein